MTKPELIELVKNTASAHHLDPSLICAIVEQESEWEPWAIRHEPAFESKYVKPLHLADTEEVARSISWGLMQTMLQSIRELGYTGHAAALCDPALGVEWGCQLFSKKLAKANGNVKQALLYWNGGENPQYADEVLVRVAHYQEDAPNDDTLDKAK